jgi:hypothetical protein
LTLIDREIITENKALKKIQLRRSLLQNKQDIQLIAAKLKKLNFEKTRILYACAEFYHSCEISAVGE